MFKRKIEHVIEEHFSSKSDKILVIDGARQIGKTFIIRYVCQKLFPNYIEINLKDDFENKKEFDKVRNIDSFYLYISSLHGDKLGNKEDTLIFLDEIQVYPHLLTMLKPLRTDNRYTYIVSGSLLGITLKHTFIPMGSITEQKMYPMDFEEFLWANGVGNDAIEHLKTSFINKTPIEVGVHNVVLDLFKKYLLCGGLPDAVKEFVINKNIFKMRRVHQETLEYYKDDCSQYDEEHKLKIRRIYDSMPSYMQNKVKRIQASKIEGIKKSTMEKYADEFDYLISSGISLGVNAVSNPIFPLVESSSKNLIKLYYNDVGLLTNILYKNNISAVMNDESGVNLGSVYETVVAQELIAHGHELFYFDSKKVGEVDYLLNDYNNLTVLPVEVKSGDDSHNFRAIPKLVDQNGNYKLKYGYILSNENKIYGKDSLIYLPIYLVMFI